MKGIILAYDFQAGLGIVSGDDGIRYSLAGADWKELDAPQRGQRVDFDGREGRAVEVYREVVGPAVGASLGSPTELDVTGLSPYYQEEFRRIRNSGGTYRGKWNWGAFAFGTIWALTKELWLAAGISVVVGLLTAGIGFIAYWFIFGARGTYLYYTLHTTRKQLPY